VVEFLLGLLVHGVITGSMYAAVALGLTLTYGIMGILNFAHGEMLMVGSYVAYVLVTRYQQSFAVAAVGAIVVVAALALIIERTTFRFARSEHLNGLVISLGLIAILQNSALAVWGADPLSIPPPLPQIIEFAGTGVGLQRLVASAVTLVLIVAVMLFLKLTPLGKAIRATAQNPAVASIFGIKANRIISITFVLGAALAALVGAFIGTIYTLTPFMGGLPALKGFVVVILGGLGSVGGAVIAGLLLGVVESFGGALVSSAFRDGFGFAMLILVLLVRPWGLFGQRPERDET
jgi:branched-chain amino acid transport system permease protein